MCKLVLNLLRVLVLRKAEDDLRPMMSGSLTKVILAKCIVG
jgi:hypothetical protein